MIIPIGSDCGLAELCKTYNLRIASFPFDWTVSYNGVSKCFEDNFATFTEPLQDRINIHDIFFNHDFKDTVEEDKEKYTRRCERLLSILETSEEEILFFRKGHAPHHHYEHNGKYSTITSDIDDAEQLSHILSSRYPQLKYTIIVVLVCGKCFDPTLTYTSDRVKIYNIAATEVDDVRFHELFRRILEV
jgi:hypothetical protein